MNKVSVVKLPRLRDIRQRRFVTQSEIADAAGLSRQTVNRIEEGQMPAQFKTVRKIAAVLGVEPRDLIEAPGACS